MQRKRVCLKCLGKIKDIVTLNVPVILIRKRPKRPKEYQGNKKFKETRNWIFISIHYIFIIYTTFKG